MTASKTQLIGGNFQDSEGNILANGYLKLLLNQDNRVTGVASVCAGIEITIQLDSNGNVASSTSTPAAANQYMWATDVMVTPNAYYRVTGYSAAGQPVWGPNNQQITSGGVGGGTFDTGLWTPNSALSWTPPIQPLDIEVAGVPFSSQFLLDFIAGSNVTIVDNGSGQLEISATVPASVNFEANGTPLASQATVNFESTDGSVTITNPSGGNVNLSAPGVLIGGTSGQGWLQPNQYAPFPSSVSTGGVGTYIGNGTSSPVGSQVTCIQITIPFAITIRKVSIYVITGNGSGYIVPGIYNAAGTTLLVGPTAMDTHSASATMRSVTLGSPVTLQPGTYWFVTGVDSTGGGGTCAGTVGIVHSQDAVNQNGVVRCGTAANAVTGSGASSALPSSLGTITAAGSGSTVSIPLILFES